ncbi:MAG: hypothetical protein ACXVIQ_12390, partial [Ilumatobacteraceae bacterium]
IASLGDVSLLAPVSEVLGAVRRAKTEAKLSQRAPVEELIVDGPPNTLAAIEACRADLAEAGGIAEFTMSPGDVLLIAVRLAPSTN